MKDRQLLLINKLLSQGKLAIGELSHILTVSSRTIRNDVTEINQTLGDLALAQITNNRGQLTFHLSLKEKQTLARYLAIGADSFLDPKKRQLDIIISFLQAPKQVKIYEEQEKLQVSKSTMAKDIRQVRRFLAKYSLVLNTQQGAEIIGAERNIRTMIQQLIVENVDISRLVEKKNFKGSDSYQIVIAYLKAQVLQQTNKTAQKLIHGGRYDGISARQAQISVLMAIWIRRISEKHYLDDGQVSNWEVANTKIRAELKKLLQKLNLTAPENELSYMTFIIKTFLGEKEVRLDKWNQSELLTLRLIDYMSAVEKINYRDSEQLYEQLNSHISAFLQRQEDHIEIFNPLTAVLKTNYAAIYHDVSAFFTKQYHQKVSEGERAYITVYFSTYYEESSKERGFYRVAVLCNYGEATGQLLAANLARNMNIEVVAVLGTQDINSLKRLKIDFVVKTIAKSTAPIPSFKMSPLPMQGDYAKLRSFIAETDIKKHHEPLNKQDSGRNLLKDIVSLVETQTGHAVSAGVVDQIISILAAHQIDIKEREVKPLLRDLLTDDKIQIKIEANNWREAIEKASQPLLANRSINSQYVTAMEDSVAKFGPYIVIGPGIALAHARPEDGVAKLDVSVASLAKPINFGNKANDPVKIIFVLSAIDSYSHLNVLKAIVNLINKPNKISELFAQDNPADFKKILLGTTK